MRTTCIGCWRVGPKASSSIHIEIILKPTRPYFGVRASAMINVAVAFLGLFSASVFLAHAIEAFSTRKKHWLVQRPAGRPNP
jgi:hypothetical protein